VPRLDASRAMACLIGAQIALHAAQSEWKRVTPVERGQAMTFDPAPAPSGAVRLIFEYEGSRPRRAVDGG
jgi:hypothetical protein